MTNISPFQNIPQAQTVSQTQAAPEAQAVPQPQAAPDTQAMLQPQTCSEQLILTVNNHWIQCVRPVLAVIAAWLIFSLIMFIAQIFDTTSTALSIAVTFIGIAGLVVAHHLFFIFIFEWMLSGIYVTTERIIKTETEAYMRNDVVYLELERITKFQKERHGLFQNIFDYGSIVVSIGGLKEDTTIDYIPNPGKLMNFIEAIQQASFKGMTPEQMRSVYKKSQMLFQNHLPPHSPCS